MKKILLIMLLPIICSGQDTTTNSITGTMRSCMSHSVPYDLKHGYVCYKQINDSTFQFEVMGDTMEAINKLLIEIREFEDKYYASEYLIGIANIELHIAQQKRAFGNTEWVKEVQSRLNEYNKFKSKYRNIYKSYRKRKQINQ